MSVSGARRVPCWLKEDPGPRRERKIIEQKFPPQPATSQKPELTTRSELPGQEKQPNVKAISQPSRKKQQDLCIEIEMQR